MDLPFIVNWKTRSRKDTPRVFLVTLLGTFIYNQGSVGMQGDKYEAIWNTVWNRVKTYDNIDASQIDAFFSRLQPQAFSEGFLMLTADTDFIKSWIESHYTVVIKQALQEIYGIPFSLAIEVDPSAAVPRASSETSAPLSIPAPLSQVSSVPTPGHSAVIAPLQPNPSPAVSPLETTPVAPIDDQLISNYTFENFVRGTSNRMAYSMAVAVAETPGDRQFNPLFIYGKSGLGKTHLLRSIQNYINKTYPQLQTVYVDTMELVNDYTDAATSKSNKAFNDFKQRYENADVLLIDDVQGLQNKKETLNMVFQILNRMIDHGKQVVLSADRAPKHIDIEERYQSRFNSGITRDIQPPELETKLGIIRNYIEECKHTGSSDFTISPDVQEYIAENSSSNIRELKSAVTKVIFELRNSGKNDITIDEVSKLLIDHFSGGAMKRLSIGEIQKIVEHYYNISHSDLVGKKRSANITYARQIAIYLCRTMIDIPYNNIGTEFNRDHTTVMYSVNSVEEKLKDNRGLNEELEILRQMILEQ